MKAFVFVVLLVALNAGAYSVVSSDLYWVWVMTMAEDTVHVFGSDSPSGIEVMTYFIVTMGYLLPFVAAFLLWFFLEDGFTGAEERARRKEAEARAIRCLAEQRRQELLASMRLPQRPGP